MQLHCSSAVVAGIVAAVFAEAVADVVCKPVVFFRVASTVVASILAQLQMEMASVEGEFGSLG